MKKILTSIILLALALTGCGTATDNSGNRENGDKNTLTVCTSFYAIYDFTRQVSGDRAEIINLVPTGTEPHDWEPSSHDMLTVSKADILFYNGLGMEGWIDSVKASAGEDKTLYVELSEGLAEEGENDPHIWLDPLKAMEMTDKIEAAMSERDSENADYYAANADAFKERLTLLDREYTEALTPYKGKSIVVSHQAYSYLCQSYGLEQVAIEGIIPQSEPSPEQMKTIIDYIKENEIRYIFFEELLSPKVAQTISEATGAELLELNPFEGLSQEDIASGADYISVMEQNLENLKRALGE